MCFFKRVLPFLLALFVGVAMFSVVRHKLQNRLIPNDARELSVMSIATKAPRVLPNIHVLSVMTMQEVFEFERMGGNYEGAKVISPPGAQYTVAKTKDYKQGVLQVSFLFGPDGVISEIMPLIKRQDCGNCLKGANIVEIDPRDPNSSGFKEAAFEAVRRIKFIPGSVGGRSVAMHGLAECVFRLD